MRLRFIQGMFVCGGLGFISVVMSAAHHEDRPVAPEPLVVGPFIVLEIDREFLQGVKYENHRIYLQRQAHRRQEAITLRSSEAKGEAYRKWLNGEYDLVSPAHAGHAVNAWTDWVETSANYVEYWVGEKKILHLKRAPR